MKDKIFLDTNIFVYSFDTFDLEKNNRSQEIVMSAINSENYFTSYQVIQEFSNVALRKFTTPLKPNDLKQYLKSVLFPICRIFYTNDLILKAIEIKEKHLYSFYDSLILSAAIMCNCDLLYSEDLNDHGKIQNLRIENPFK